ncbi:MAG: GerMN domain-containing protein [Treponema sp.]|nr:GerMN domain-containing protein [Treponema sp.]
MAARKNQKASQEKMSWGAQAMVIFWIVFIVIIISVFMANADTIKRNFGLFRTRLTTTPAIEALPPDITESEPSIQEHPQETTAVQVQTPAGETEKTAPTAEPQKPAAQNPSQTPTQQRNEPARNPSQPAQTRDRNIYYTQIDKDGQILQSRVSRKIQASDSPMQDTLNTMLMGPSADELNKGIINLIPQNTRVISATVRGDTAYINFNEDFLFNTFGVEGYVAQLRQIVWTVTEFPNVKDVQILIEGRRLDYLGEGIWIGSPISRQSF